MRVQIWGQCHLGIEGQPHVGWPPGNRAVVLLSIIICLRMPVTETWVQWVYSSISECLARNTGIEWLSITAIEQEEFLAARMRKTSNYPFESISTGLHFTAGIVSVTLGTVTPLEKRIQHIPRLLHPPTGGLQLNNCQEDTPCGSWGRLTVGPHCCFFKPKNIAVNVASTFAGRCGNLSFINRKQFQIRRGDN